MGMAIEHDRRGGRLEDVRGVNFVEHVLVFILRRTMAENESIMLDRPEGKLLEKTAIRRTEMFARPVGSRLRGGIESVALFEISHVAIVIASNVQLGRFERSHGVEDLIRLRAV